MELVKVEFMKKKENQAVTENRSYTREQQSYDTWT